MVHSSEQAHIEELLPEERTRQFIESGNFFEANKDTLRDMFTALNRADKWSENPADPDFIRYIRTGWIGTEHGNGAKKDQFTPEEFENAKPFFEKLGLVDEVLPPEDQEFDEVFIGGGTMQALIRRTDTAEEALQTRGAKVARLTIAAGMRPREARDGTNEEILSTAGRFSGNDVRHIPWIQKGRTVYRDAKGRFATRFSESLDFAGEGKWRLTETDLARIALAKRVPSAEAAARINLRLYNLNDPHDPYYTSQHDALEDAASSPVTSYEYKVGERTYEVMNAPADKRNGDPRPTTNSTIAEWLHSRDLPEGAKVLFVTSNPHALRMARTFHKTLRRLQRSDVQVSLAATSAPGGAPIQLFLGEIGRMIDSDARENHGLQQ